MNLLAPKNYRLKQEHEDFLQATALKAGHGNRSLMLRKLLDREIAKAERNKNKSAA